jgi:hypothetical protein
MSPTNQQLFQIVGELQKILSHDRCTRQSLASSRSTLTSLQLPSDPWLVRKWYDESLRILQVWTEVVVVAIDAGELAGSVVDG